jgi:hypothetical protein
MTVRTYKIEDAAGVAACRAVVVGSAAEGVAKPGAANAGKVVGITREAQTVQYKGVPVQLDGVAQCEMYSSGSMGDAVNIGDTSGRLASCQAALVDLAETTAYLTYVVGYAERDWTQTGDVIPVRLNPFVKLTPVT